MMSSREEEKEKSIDNLIAAIDKAYHHPGKLASRSFLMGLMSGLGATVGVALIIALLGFLIRQFGGLPLIGQFLQDIGHFLTNVRR